MSPDLSLGVTDAPAEADVALIETELLAYNAGCAAPGARRPLCVFVRGADGRAVGGATGYTDRGWLYVDCFWLPQHLRRGGLGRRVLRAAEGEARRRGCGDSRLFTFSFQAQGFYERNGYAVFGVLDGFPPGHSQVWMRKALV